MLRDFNNYIYGFHNWLAVRFMERMVLEFLFTKSRLNEGLIFEKDIASIHSNPKYLEDLRRGKPEYTYQAMKKETKRLGKYLDFSMRQDCDLDSIKDIFNMDKILMDSNF
jgi:hypothetical protein